jgi:peptidoglycan hydrolase-like protein with peptidoglycan-binding domain
MKEWNMRRTMKRIFTKDFWKLEPLRAWPHRLRDASSAALDRLIETAGGGLDRKQKLALSLVLVALLAVVSWVAGSKIQSPAEAAARTAPPAPSPILVPVEERILTSDIITRGTARFGLPQSISLALSPLKADASVITTLPAQGDQLNEGDVLLTASGRPVFLLQGKIPAYRDLVSGLSGEDVRQLEAALKRLRFDPGPVDGVYDEKTSAAVAGWYAAAGFVSFGPTGEQLTKIRSLESDLALAVNEKLAADDALALAPLAVEAARAQAASDVATASGSARTAAQLAGEIAIRAAQDSEKAAGREVERLTHLVDQLTADFEAARRQADSPVPLGEIVFVSAFPVRVEEIKAQIGDSASGPVMVVTNNQLAIDSSLPLAEAPLVKPGMPVAIDEPDLGLQATGVVSRVAASPGTDGVDGYHIYFEILVDETPVRLEGFSLRLTIPVESTGGAVTVVPVSALFLAADGTSRVQVDNNGSLEFVVVKPGLSADGFVQVTPVDGTLSAGQLVLVGYEKNQE